MGLRLLYGLKTRDAAYLNIFYPSRRLKEAAQTLGLTYAQRLFPLEPDFSADKWLHDQVAVSELQDWAAGQVVLLRGDLPQAVYRIVAASAARIVNPWESVALSGDKLAAAAFFGRLGTVHPHTSLLTESAATTEISGDSNTELRADRQFTYPFVLKPRYGKKGWQVSLINNAQELAAYPADADTLIQDFVGGRPGSDLRFFYAAFSDAGHNPAAASPGSICVLRSAEGFLSNAAQGGHMTTYQPGPELQAEADRIFLASGLIYGTVDFLFADAQGRQFTVCELNSCPGFEELECACRVDAAQAILRSALGIDT
ncbi:MAG: hypothetical protein KKC64_10590 [Spirochaetes bacterium]|nr:hypothetical protein [Spirochaetota bacterium]